MKTKSNIIALVALLVPVALVAACSSTDTTGAGPLNHADGGAGNVDSSVGPGGGSEGGGGDAAVDDSGYNVCAKGLVFDSTRVPGFPNPPQP